MLQGPQRTSRSSAPQISLRSSDYFIDLQGPQVFKVLKDRKGHQILNVLKDLQGPQGPQGTQSTHMGLIIRNKII